MSGISTIGYVNIRQQLPTIRIEQHYAQFTKGGFEQADLHIEYEPARTYQHATQVKVDIDQYPCRKATGGYLNHTDFAIKYGQKGFFDLSENTSKFTQQGWDAAKNAARPGAMYIASRYKSQFAAQFKEWPECNIVVMPPPEFTVTPSRVEGTIDPGETKVRIDNIKSKVDMEYDPGTARTYIADEGFIHQWVTMGYVDMEA